MAQAEKFIKAKEAMEKGNYKEAIELLEQYIKEEPMDMDARIYYYRAVQDQQDNVPVAKAAPETKTAPAEKPKAKTGDDSDDGPKDCIWVKAGVVANRICDHDFQCDTCEFGQQIQEERKQKRAEAKMEGMKDIPGSQRQCRYMLSGKVAYRVCPFVYHCGTCEFDQIMQDKR